MKLKRCTCRQCKYGIHTKSESENVRYQVRASRHYIKQVIHTATKTNDLDVIDDICSGLDTVIGIDYTD